MSWHNLKPVYMNRWLISDFNRSVKELFFNTVFLDLIPNKACYFFLAEEQGD